MDDKKKEKYEKKAKEAKDKYEIEKKKFEDSKGKVAGKRAAPEPPSKKDAKSNGNSKK